jgi:hypothetical protein
VGAHLVAVSHGHHSEPAGGGVVFLLLQDLHVPHIQAAGCEQYRAVQQSRCRQYMWAVRGSRKGAAWEQVRAA